MIKNRIIAFGFKPADQFEANPDNFRIHPEEQQKIVKTVLDQIGWAGVVIENTRTGRVIDGHERIWEALQDGSEVPFVQVDLSPEEERILLLAYDATGHMARIDYAKANDLIASIRADAPKAWQEEVIRAVDDEYLLSAVRPGGTPPANPPADTPRTRELVCPHCGGIFTDDQ